MIKKIFYFIKKRLINKKYVNDTFTNEIIKGPNIFIGNYTYGMPQILIYDSNSSLIIGKFCSFGGDIKIYLGGNHRTDWISTYPFNSFKFAFPEFHNRIKGHPQSKGDVIIGNDVWVGNNSIILSGVSVGDGAVIGANSVVTKTIGAYEIWAGNPARFIRKRFDDEKINFLTKIAWWNWEIKKIKENVLLLNNDNVEEFFKLNYIK
jgi:acetyltransferase-like isoleucine patch superfamily enzyme